MRALFLESVFFAFLGVLFFLWLSLGWHRKRTGEEEKIYE